MVMVVINIQLLLSAIPYNIHHAKVYVNMSFMLLRCHVNETLATPTPFLMWALSLVLV